jgi:imidazole glycerol-phosphate synthase subunit HisH
MSVRALIVAAGGANYGSLREACRRVGVMADISDDPSRIAAASHVILPGVGAAAQAMRTLRERGLDRVLAARTQPLLGICLGMQLLFEQSEEAAPADPDAPDREQTVIPAQAGIRSDLPHERMDSGMTSRTAVESRRNDEQERCSATAAARVACLGLLAGDVRRLPPAPRWPHMGWNTLQAHAPAHPLLDDIANGEWFYFVHGYAAVAGSHAIASSDHGGPFAAVVSHRNIHGVQFHPEKSAAPGRRLLRNFFGLRCN